ncbi:glycosyltransferase family 2 protein [Antarcticibacterium sp. 1MA-6-2]|uniref:glycosyltransferase family 2 protein n=1 Tax=Antarcticibacterium sp. 1MA-6-2 TaxID=2908210 RepID=UPI001F211288|nr:glycosyltransferase family 2 protein [Antarcticibacterium sp. 1MA-6-2]UJH91296.1 glycosyltransferase family 2 protein [Antarcticibacterium sp. 1MA-6-2]
MPHISIVSPIYNAGKIIPELIRRIEASVEVITADYEIIFVEDGGPDNSWEVIQQYAVERPKLKGYKLSRNFGQHYAVTAGLDLAKGDWVVVMDCDLQDQPEEIEKLYLKAQEGYDLVLAQRMERKDNALKKLFSKSFNRTLGYLTGAEQDETVGSFGIYSRKVVNAIVSMRESIRYFPTMVKWVGFKTAKVEVAHNYREEGKSNYSVGKLFKLATDIILAYSDKPLRLLVSSGLIISIISFLVAVFYFLKWLIDGVDVLGFTSLIISIWLLSGIIILTLGIVGLYVGKIFEGVKNRPLYIISEEVNHQKENSEDFRLKGFPSPNLQR